MNGFFGGMFRPGMGMGGMMQKPMGLMSARAPMQGPMQPNYFPPAPQAPGLMGSMTGGDMLGMASQAFGSGQGQQEQLAPPPSFYQKSGKPAPQLSAMQYEQPRPMSRLNAFFGGM
jgi:hypothetical protein